jgi:hypothetical protein
MAHPARRVMPNGPVGRKLQRFKCMSKAKGAYIYIYMPMCEVVAEYEPPQHLSKGILRKALYWSDPSSVTDLWRQARARAWASGS